MIQGTDITNECVLLRRKAAAIRAKSAVLKARSAAVKAKSAELIAKGTAHSGNARIYHLTQVRRIWEKNTFPISLAESEIQ